VDHVRVVSHGSATEHYVRLPDGQVELIARLGEGAPSVSVVGTRSSPLSKEATPLGESLLFRFKPGRACPFFGVPLEELTDRVVPLHELRRPLEASLLKALQTAKPEARAQALQDALCGELAAPAFEPSGAPVVRRALDAVAAAIHLPRVAQLAREVGVSERHLRRAFGEVVGLTPKEYLRVARFRRALRHARRAHGSSWTRIAHEHGYYDQAHLNAEFRALAGRAPRDLR
jgi:AraC-like DNA-binding protein